MPLPSDPVGRALVQMIARDRYERWLLTETQSILGRGLQDIVTTLINKFATLSPGELQRRALLFRQIDGILSRTYGEGADFLLREMKGYAGIEAHATIGHLAALVADSPTAEITLANLTRAEVKAIAEFPIAGLGISDWFEKQASDMNAGIRGQIQLGLMNGETSPAIARRLLPATPTPEVPGILPRSRRGTLMLVRTTVTTIQVRASYETLASIGDKYVPAYRYVAVRDTRTTPICRALDGKVYRFDDPRAKQPPQHIGCRSGIVAEPNYKAMGIPAPNSVAGGFTMGSYAKWLDAQSQQLQTDILGRAGADLYRSGKAGLADLINSDGRRMTQAALRATFGE